MSRFDTMKAWKEKFGTEITYDCLRKQYKKIEKGKKAQNLVESIYYDIRANLDKEAILEKYNLVEIELTEIILKIEEIFKLNISLEGNDFILERFEFSKARRNSLIKRIVEIEPKDFTLGIMSDTHFNSLAFEEEAYYKFIGSCIENKVDRVVIAGDITDGDGTVFRGHRYEVECLGIDRIKKLTTRLLNEIPVPIDIIGGNHDAIFMKNSGFDLLRAISLEIPRLNYIPSMRGIYVYKAGNHRLRVALQHGDRGSTKSISFRSQNFADASLKIYHMIPDLLVVGHYHQQLVLPRYNGMTAVMSGSFQGITPYLMRFMDEPVVGGMIIPYKFDENGFTMKNIIIKDYPITKDIFNGGGYYSKE